MWPNELIGRCLAAYAEVVQATMVIGLFAKTTSYARVFQRTNWPADICDALLVSPELRGGGGALVKVPRAIGEAFAVIGATETLGADWKSSDDVPVRVVRVGAGSARGTAERG